MKTISIHIECNGELYAGTPEPYSDEAYDKYCRTALGAAKADADAFGMNCGNRRVYFPGRMLQQSIISVVIEENEEDAGGGE